MGRLLNEAQRSKAGHRKCVAAFWRLADKDFDGTMDALLSCLQHVLLVAQVRLYLKILPQASCLNQGLFWGA